MKHRPSLPASVPIRFSGVEVALHKDKRVSKGTTDYDQEN
jgi:hypothetical protein